MSDETKRPSDPNAFPGTDAHGYVCMGMTLRDWFAGQALAAQGDNDDEAENIAYGCYALADAMMKAREAGK